MSDHCPGVSGSPPRLVEHPSDVLVARDEPATLRCEAATQPGQPPPTVTWMKDGAEVSSVMLHEEDMNMNMNPPGVCVQVRVAPQHPASHRVLLPSGALFFLKAVAGKREDDRGTYW